MDVERFAQQLLAFSIQHDGGYDLVLRVGPDQELYYRFSESRADPVHMMSWEARREAVGPVGAAGERAGWLASMDFRRDADGLVGRLVGMPSTIGDARLIAGLALFLLEHAYDLPEDAAVSVALEAA